MIFLLIIWDIYRHRAASGGYIKIIELLIKAKSRINPKDVEGNTPLHYACEEGHGDCAVYLIENNANEDQLNSDGKTPIDLCPTKEVKNFIISSTQ